MADKYGSCRVVSPIPSLPLGIIIYYIIYSIQNHKTSYFSEQLELLPKMKMR